MKNYLKYIILGVLIVFSISIVMFMYQDWTTKPEEDPRIAEAKTKTKEQDIYWYSTMNKIAYVAILVVCLASVGMLTYSIAKSRLKKASVHTYKIGKYNEVIVHEKDLSIAAPIAMGLMNAEQLKQMNGGVEQAFELYTKMAEVQTKQIQALVGKRGVVPAVAYQAAPEQPAPPALSAGTGGEIPTFQKLLTSGAIAPGKPMILGYEDGQPIEGSFLDIYSAAVAGESGSGKTATLLFLIGSGLVACGARYIGIDPHYPHPKSLGFKTKPLWETGLMRMATYKDDMLVVLAEIERIIDRRLKQIDKNDTPVVLVIDELAFLSKTSIGSQLAHTMERISTEGRKCSVYMLASSQTWLAARTGDSSVVRDTLTSAYVHRIKPKQANLLLQDKEEAEKVRKYVKQAGEVLFCPVNDDSTICRMPFTTEQDMELIARMLKDQVITVTAQTVPPAASTLAEKTAHTQLPDAHAQWTDEEAVKQLPEPTTPILDPKLLTVEMLRERMLASPLGAEGWQKQIVTSSGVKDTTLKEILDGKRKLSLQTAKKLIPYIFS